MKTTIPALPATYDELQFFRGNDIYLPEMDREELIAAFFPPTVTQLAQGLSNTTSAFYGLMLQEIGKRYGNDIIESVSKTTIYNLGRRTTRRLLLKYPDLERDARGIAKVAMFAIFNASPEYSFEVTRFEKDHAEMHMRGVDRYDKIARELVFNEWMTPPIDAFAQAICDEMGLPYKATLQIISLNEESQCSYNLSFTL